MKRMWPSYYEGFTCLAQDCPLTCCCGMEISIDEETYEKYMQVEGMFGERLKREIDPAGPSFYQDEWGCMFLSREGLCQIQSQLGADMLCDTCRKYPRHEEEYPSALEYSLGLSCPEAGRRILSSGFETSYQLEENGERDEFVYDPGEKEDYQTLCRVREKLLELVYDPGISLSEKKELLGICGELLQESMDEVLEKDSRKEGETFLSQEEIGGLIERAKKVRSSPQDRDGEGEEAIQEESLLAQESLLEQEREVLTTIRGMEIPELKSLLNKLEELLQEGEEACQERAAFYRQAMEHWEEPVSYQGAVSALMGYYLYLYLAGACYDKQVNAAIQLGLFLTFAMETLARAQMVRAGKAPGLKDLTHILAAIARQVEHDENTLLLLLQYFE